jgi:hypothetical protein
MLVFAAMACATAVVGHWTIRRFWLATIVSATIAAGLFQLYLYRTLGYLDAFFLIGFVTTTGMAFAVSAVVGWLFRRAVQLQPRVP